MASVFAGNVKKIKRRSGLKDFSPRENPAEKDRVVDPSVRGATESLFLTMNIADGTYNTPISPPSPRKQLCTRSCSNKHTHSHGSGVALFSPRVLPVVMITRGVCVYEVARKYVR